MLGDNMADDLVTQEPAGFTPEPIPDSIADTEINGLEPAQPDESAPVEPADDDTTDDQVAEDPAPEESEEEPEAPDEPVEQPTDAVERSTIPDAKEQARLQFEQRNQQRQQERDYVTDQRQQIREYEQTADLDDVTQRMQILEAKQYVDTVQRNRESTQYDMARATNDIPFFKDNTLQSQVALQQSLENFANAYGVTDPGTGEWLGAQDRNGNDVSLYGYLQQQAASYEQVAANSQRQTQQSEAKMRAKAVNPSNAGKTTTTGDSLEDLYNKIGDTPLW